MIGGCAERHDVGFNIQRVWCLHPLFLVRSHYSEVGVDSDLSA